jgi:antitoxin MazE
VIVEFRKWGNSLAIRIPKALADAINARDGKRAELSVQGDTLVLRPVPRAKRKLRYSLNELLSGMTRENVPQEVDWGPPRGTEKW